MQIYHILRDTTYVIRITPCNQFFSLFHYKVICFILISIMILDVILYELFVCLFIAAVPIQYALPSLALAIKHDSSPVLASSVPFPPFLCTWELVNLILRNSPVWASFLT